MTPLNRFVVASYGIDFQPTAAINFQLTAGTDFPRTCGVNKAKEPKLVDWGSASDVGGVICQIDLPDVDYGFSADVLGRYGSLFIAEFEGVPLRQVLLSVSIDSILV